MTTLKELKQAWSRGGKKSSENMTPEARKERAKKAVLARWKRKRQSEV